MKQLIICIFALATVSCSAKLKSNVQKDMDTVTNPAATGRILGYYFRGDHDWKGQLNTIDLTRLTDINIAFLNPDAAGSFNGYNLADLADVVTTAHSNNLRIYFAIGGGEPPATLAGLLSPASRAGLITNIVKLAVDLNFDGVDVDLENDLIVADTGRYAGFVNDLHIALKAKNKLMSAALVRWSSAATFVSDVTLGKYDYINIMSYDSTGPWRPEAPGQHASYTLAVSDFEYYRSRGIPAAKLFTGVPFYGYAFGAVPKTDYSYSEIVSSFPGTENQDEYTFSTGGTVYYNGIPTIKKKVDYVKSQGGAGIMIWQLQQDLPASDPKSLLLNIYNRTTSAGK